MLFNSFAFLAFFAVVVGVSYGLPHKTRWAWLLAASVFFYGTFGLGHLALLTAITIVSYAVALGIEAAPTPGSKRLTATAGVIAVLSALFVFKYYEFFRRSLEGAGFTGWAALGGLPRFEIVAAAGLSFYTFTAVSYIVDVHQGRLRAERHFGRFALFTSFFPKLLAGPLERAKPFLEQLERPVVFNPDEVTSGLQQMLWGLFKKVVIADRLAAFVDNAYQLPALTSPADLVLATYFFAFQLYCDFSGYSDIAIGAAKVLGFDLMANFRRPYFSESVPEFWANRWHLSLSAWFRDYLYIPLGGSRTSAVRRYINVMIVFLVSGLWHGANWTFVLWGGLNGAYQVVSLATRPLRAAMFGSSHFSGSLAAIVRRVWTFHLVLVTWIFFRASSLADAGTIVSRVGTSLPALPALLRARLGASDVLLAIALIVFLLLVEALDEGEPVWQRLGRRPVALRWAVYYSLLVALIVLGTWNLQQFVYMQF